MNPDRTPEKRLDYTYTLSNRDYQTDEYLTFLAACIEQSEEVIIHTEGSGNFRDLLKAGLKGLQHALKDGNTASLGKGIDHVNVEYDDFNEEILHDFGTLASEIEEYEGAHVFYFEKDLRLLARLIREIDDLEKDTMTYIEVVNEGFYMSSKPRSYMAQQKVYLNEDIRPVVEEINQEVCGNAKCVLNQN